MPRERVFKADVGKRVHELLKAAFRKSGPGSIKKAEEGLKLRQGYYAYQRRQSTVDFGTLLATLEHLGIDDADFFADLYGLERRMEGRNLDPPDGAGPPPPAASGGPSKDLSGLRWAPEDLDLAAKLEPWIEEMDELRYDDCEAALAGLRERADGLPINAGARWLSVAGSCLRMAGDLQDARLCLDGAMAIAPSEKVRANVLQRQVYVEMRRGRFERALELAERAAGIYGRIGHLPGLGQALVDQGSVLWHSGDVRAAVRAMTSATTHLRESDRRNRCVVHQHLAVWHQQEGRLSEARDHICKARESAADRHTRAGALSVEATVLEGMKRYREAARAYEAAFEMLGEPLDRLLCLAHLVRAEMLAGSPSAAVEAARTAAQLMGSVQGDVAEAAVVELYRLTAASCARTGVVDRVISNVSALCSAPKAQTSLGDRLLRARRRLRVDRQTAAAQMGVPRVSLLKIETGRTPGYLYAERIQEWIERTSPEAQLARLALAAS